MNTYRLGVDIGGTFTDIVLLGADGAMHTKKILSTPHDYSEAIENGTTGETMASEMTGVWHEARAEAHETRAEAKARCKTLRAAAQ